MLASIARAIFGSSNDRSLKGYQRRVPAINALEDGMKALSDEALAAKTVEFRARLADGATLDELLPEAFAAVREDPDAPGSDKTPMPQGQRGRASMLPPGLPLGRMAGHRKARSWPGPNTRSNRTSPAGRHGRCRNS
jgi:hypothetical protein